MSLTLATLSVGTNDPVDVHFNPASLRVTTSNQFDDKVPNQVSKPTSFKLDVELLFDTTETGKDVHQVTRALRWAAIASGSGAVAHDDAGQDAQNSDPAKANSHLALVTLSWGTRHYQGYVESLNETLDYWSSDGVPLRATLQVSLKGTTDRFLTGKYHDLTNWRDNPVPSLPKVVATSTAADNTEAFIKMARAAGDKSTGRGLAAANGIENMRGTGGAPGGGAAFGASAGAGFSAGAGAAAGASLAVGGGAQLQAAAGFKLAGGVSVGASVGFGMGASAGLSAGAGLGASVGVGMAAGAGAGFGIGGGISAGAGIGLSAGAGFGMSAGAGIGGGVGPAGGGIGISTSTSVTGFDGVTTTTSSSTMTGFDGVTRSSSTTTTQGSAGMGFGSASAGMAAGAGAFAGLGPSRTTLPAAGFNPDSLLPPPLPAAGAGASFDVSGRLIGSGQQTAASYSDSRAGAVTW